MMSVPALAAVMLLMGTPPQSAEGPVDADGLVLDAGADVTPAPDEVAGEVKADPVVGDAAVGDEDIVVTAGTQALAGDPLQEVNLASYKVVQSVDQAVVGPVAKGYERILPEPVRDGLGNALRNIGEPVNFLNFLLQLKIGKAAETVARFAVNSTLGVGGLFDVAKKKPFKLPHRRNGFANTMGFYGVKPGPYFFLPLLGPTTLRDLAGNSLDLMLLPRLVGKPFNRTAYAVPTNVIMQLNARVERDAEIQRLQQESANPYAETRTLYLEMRQREIDALKVKRRASAPAAEPAAIPAPAAEPVAAPAPMPVPVPEAEAAAAPAPETEPAAVHAPAAVQDGAAAGSGE
jgi:phospholipid-binding lipoprotein MlaA